MSRVRNRKDRLHLSELQPDPRPRRFRQRRRSPTLPWHASQDSARKRSNIPLRWWVSELATASTTQLSSRVASSSGWRWPERWSASLALILADEPTGNLDSAMAREIIDLLEDINGSGTTVVMVTHDQEMAHRAARQIFLLDGRVIDLSNRRGSRPLFDPRRPRPPRHPPPASHNGRGASKMFLYNLRLVLEKPATQPGDVTHHSSVPSASGSPWPARSPPSYYMTRRQSPCPTSRKP